MLETVRPKARAAAEIDDVLAATTSSTGSAGHGPAERWLLRILLVGIGVAVAQQLTGINSIMYYGQRVLMEAGFTANAALVANIGSGVVAVVGGLIALRAMDRIDRRTTFTLGLS